MVIAAQLAEQGAVPILTGRNRVKLAQAAATLAGRHGSYLLDVGDERLVAEAVAQAEADFGGIDVLINNAGYGQFESFMDASTDSFSAMMDTNYMGIVRCTKAVLPGMLQRGSGHIVNIASIAGKVATAKSTGYSATKHAVLGFSNALRVELARTGVRVSTINPGPIDTPFFAQADPSGAYVSNIRWLMMKPDKVAKAVLRAIERNKPEINLPATLAAGAKLYQLFPRLSDRIAGKWMNKK